MITYLPIIPIAFARQAAVQAALVGYRTRLAAMVPSRTDAFWLSRSTFRGYR
jgi:hypothetical protein